MKALELLTRRPPVWPTFRSPLRGVALTARLGRVLGIAFTVCFITGILSHYQYTPYRWLPIPGAPYWGYRLTQGVHVITGIACIPLLLTKLWSVYHRLFVWPPVRSIVHALERGSILVLVASSVLQLGTGFLNVLQYYPWPWSFVPVHYWLSFVIIGSLALHIAVQLPRIREGLSTKLWRTGDDVVASAPLAEPSEPALEPAAPTPGGPSRRGVLIATGAGVGIVAITTVGQVIGPLEPVALLAPRLPSTGPQDLPVNRTAAAAHVMTTAKSPQYRLTVSGPTGFELTLAQLEALEAAEESWPIACVEGWSRMAHWRGPRLLTLVERAGGSASSTITLVSLEKNGYNKSHVFGPQLPKALLATHLNGERIDLDHGYPLRLIAPDRAGVLNTKWLTRIEVAK